jgi:transcriptional regulator with XRE-family HTH domain
MYYQTIRIARENANKTVEMVATYLGMDTELYINYEKLNEMPSILHWCRLMEFFDCMILPVNIHISYPNDIKAELSKAIDEYGHRSNSYKDNFEKASKINDSLSKLILFSESAFNIDELLKGIPLEELIIHFEPSIRSIHFLLDRDGEDLITKALDCIGELSKPIE